MFGLIILLVGDLFTLIIINKSGYTGYIFSSWGKIVRIRLQLLLKTERLYRISLILQGLTVANLQ